MRLLVACALLTACSASARTPKNPLKGKTQLILVVTSDWDATEGTLRRYVRKGSGWKQVGEVVPIEVGASGLGWGRGLHGEGAWAGHDGPSKEEGDGRSPAGAFAIGAIYGSGDAPRGARDWTRVGPGWRCVDDPDSDRYNQVFDATGMLETWKSAEEMDQSLYRYVVVVQHNPRPVRVWAGSCIFLHLSSGAPTLGCTSMPETHLRALIQWIEPKRAAYVALPKSEFERVSTAWGLPSL